MTSGAHFLISWLSTVELLNERRERTIVALSGILPDVDGLGGVVDSITGTTSYYDKYHHYFGHCGLFAVIVSAIAYFLAKSQKKLTCILTYTIIHIHLLCDIIGSKGPDGHQWPIYYFYPFNTDFGLTWSGQWELNAWQNLAIMISLFLGCAFYAIRKRITFIEVISPRLQSAVFQMYDNYKR